MNISDVLKKLKKEDKDALYYAFENGESHMVIYEDKKFIGVNIKQTECHTISFEQGFWCLGEIK